MLFLLFSFSAMATQTVYVNGIPIEIENMDMKDGKVHVQVKEDYLQCFLANELESPLKKSETKKPQLSSKSSSRRRSFRGSSSTSRGSLSSSSRSRGFRRTSPSGGSAPSGVTEGAVSSRSRSFRRRARRPASARPSLSTSSRRTSVTRSKPGKTRFNNGVRSIADLPDVSEAELKKAAGGPKSIDSLKDSNDPLLDEILEKENQGREQSETLNYQ